MQPSILAFLEQVRATAQSGLHHAKNPYDRDRYQRLFDLSLGEYSLLMGMDVEEVRSMFLQESGSITPKCAASAAIFNDDGEILLIRRADNGRLTLPGGACEPGESGYPARRAAPPRTAGRQNLSTISISTDIQTILQPSSSLVLSRMPPARRPRTGNSEMANSSLSLRSRGRGL